MARKMVMGCENFKEQDYFLFQWRNETYYLGKKKKRQLKIYEHWVDVNIEQANSITKHESDEMRQLRAENEASRENPKI